MDHGYEPLDWPNAGRCGGRSAVHITHRPLKSLCLATHRPLAKDLFTSYILFWDENCDSTTPLYTITQVLRTQTSRGQFSPVVLCCWAPHGMALHHYESPLPSEPPLGGGAQAFFSKPHPYLQVSGLLLLAAGSE